MPPERVFKILAVDDEPMMLGIYQAALSEQGYQVATAGDGQQALEAVFQVNPDVILMDIVMPKMDGVEATQRLKADPRTKNIPVIMVTGLGSIEDRVKGLEAGADDFLSKPFNLDELVVRVRSLARLKDLQDRLAQKQSESPEKSEKPEGRTSPLVLVVEDDQRIVRICENMLAAGGCQAMDAPGAATALKFLEQEIPDLVILDLMLPDRDGLDLLAEMKKNPEMSLVPVIILTALSDLKTKVKGFYIGADDYLVKPVSSLELLARVRANLRKRILFKKLG